MNSSNELNTRVHGIGPRPLHQVRPLRAEYATPEAVDVSDLLQAETRIEALRLLVLAFLREVDSLKKMVSAHPTKKRDVVDLDGEIDAFETGLIREALIRSNGNQRDAARLLKIKPTTLNAKMKRLNITVETTVTGVE